jgi:hypothetical protein
MNDTIKSGDVFSLQRNGADVIHDGLSLEPGRVYGRTKIYKNDVLVHNELKEVYADGASPNAIVGGSGTTSPTGLKAYFAESMSTAVDRALNNLFDTSNVSAANYNLVEESTVNVAVAAKDGIVIGASNSTGDGPAYAAVTTVLTAANTYGRKWRGVFTATGAVQVAFAVIGWNLKGNTTGITNTVELLTTPYATQQFQTQTLATNDTLTIEWEIFIA